MEPLNEMEVAIKNSGIEAVSEMKLLAGYTSDWNNDKEIQDLPMEKKEIDLTWGQNTTFQNAESLSNEIQEETKR